MIHPHAKRSSSNLMAYLIERGLELLFPGNLS